MHELLNFISMVIGLYTYVVIAMVIMSWLVSFGVINGYSPVVRQINEVLYRLTEPFLGPIRRAMPDFGAVDFSPVILLLVIFFIQSVIIPNLHRVIA